MIKVTNLKKNFGSLQVLTGIDNQINKGQVVSIIGPSGSGKSTFLRCLNLTEIPTSGEIEFNGKIIFSNTSYELKKQLEAIKKDKKSSQYQELLLKYKKTKKEDSKYDRNFRSKNKETTETIC